MIGIVKILTLKEDFRFLQQDRFDPLCQLQELDKNHPNLILFLGIIFYNTHHA
jgi:hypothetical protein